MWKVIGASVQGTSHERGGLPCQDVHACGQSGDTLVVVIADGAGSAACGADGAAVAVAGAYEILTSVVPSPEEEDFWEKQLARACEEARGRVESEAVAAGRPLAEFASTLLLLVATESALIAGQVGDGAVIAEEDGALFTVLAPQRGEYANETRFLTSGEQAGPLALGLHRGRVTALAAMSDGLLNLALLRAEEAPYPAFFQPLFRFCAESSDNAGAVEQLSAFLASPRVCQRTDDDKTLVLATRRPPRPEG